MGLMRRLGLGNVSGCFRLFHMVSDCFRLFHAFELKFDRLVFRPEGPKDNSAGQRPAEMNVISLKPCMSDRWFEFLQI